MLGRMFEYSNVSLIFKCILKLPLALAVPLVELFAASLSVIFQLQLEDSTCPVLIGIEY